MNITLIPSLLSGLSSLQQTIISDYLGSAFLVILGITALVGFWKKSIRDVLTAFGLAILVAVLLFGAAGLVGESGTLTNVAKDQLSSINTILVE